MRKTRSQKCPGCHTNRNDQHFGLPTGACIGPPLDIDKDNVNAGTSNEENHMASRDYPISRSDEDQNTLSPPETVSALVSAIRELSLQMESMQSEISRIKDTKASTCN